jgi:hypothetical protein
MSNPAKRVIHKKSGRRYEIIRENVKNCTNAQDGQLMVYYTNGELYFVREHSEFWEKFERA